MRPYPRIIETMLLIKRLTAKVISPTTRPYKISGQVNARTIIVSTNKYITRAIAPDIELLTRFLLKFVQFMDNLSISTVVFWLRVVFHKWRWTEIAVTLGLLFIVFHRKAWPMTFIASAARTVRVTRASNAAKRPEEPSATSARTPCLPRSVNITISTFETLPNQLTANPPAQDTPHALCRAMVSSYAHGWAGVRYSPRGISCGQYP